MIKCNMCWRKYESEEDLKLISKKTEHKTETNEYSLCCKTCKTDAYLINIE